MKFLFILLLAVTANSSNNFTNEHSYYNSTFVKIIMTEDIGLRDAIYTTPSVVLIGKNNGEILRCLQEDPNECEVIHNAKSMVNSIVISGEYFYATLESGTILKCGLYEKSCKTHWTTGTPFVALASGGGYLYAGYPDSKIWLCDLHQPDSCHALHGETSPVYSLALSEKYIYAGLLDGRLIRCSLSSENSCIVLYNMSRYIFGMTSMGNRIFAVTDDGLLWNCSRTSVDTVDSCMSSATHVSSPRDITAFNGLLYVLNEDGVRICRTNNNTCRDYVYHKESYRSLAFAYSTYRMQSRYLNEETTCTWQVDFKCPPYVFYFDIQERAMLEVHVRDGRLYNSKGFLVDTTKADEGSSGPTAIFAMGPDGRILLSNLHKEGLIHTSSFFAGNPVSGAGEMVVKNGIIRKINTCSEHYQPDLNLNKQVIQSLLMQGYTEHIDLQECCKDEIDLSQNFTPKQ